MLAISIKILPKLLFLLVLISSFCGFSQEAPWYVIKKEGNGIFPIKDDGAVVIHRDSRIDTLIKHHIQFNQSRDGIQGYRIHVFFDAGNLSLRRATEAAEHFQTLFPGDTAYISFSEPYYRVRVGDFRTRLDAEGYLQKINSDYPNAFVIRDQINFPKLED
jgi:hypothetical protein